jgi:hypothetical protein
VLLMRNFTKISALMCTVYDTGGVRSLLRRWMDGQKSTSRYYGLKTPKTNKAHSERRSKIFKHYHIFRWCFHLIVVRGFEYARDPESYTSGSVATGRASLAGQVKG